MISLAVNLFSTPRHLIMYFIVKDFNKQVRRRLEITREIQTQINFMITFFRNLADGLEEPTQQNRIDIERAFRHIQKATTIVSTQANRVSNGDILSTDRLQLAQEEIDLAVNELTSGGFFIDDSTLEDPGTRRNFAQSAGVSVSIEDPLAGIKKIENWIEAVNEKYLSPTLSPEQRANNIGKVQELIFEKINEFPYGVRRMLAIFAFQRQSRYLFSLLPIPTPVDGTVLENTTGVDFILDLFDTSVVDRNQRAFDYTFDGVTGLAELQKLAITQFEQDFKIIEAEGGIFKNALLPSAKQLRDIRDDMRLYRTENPRPNPEKDLETTNKKIQWATDAIQAKSTLQLALQAPIGYGSNKSYPLEDQRYLQEAEDLFLELKEYIQTEEAENLDRATDIVAIAVRYLGMLSATPAVLASTKVQRNVISGLQALKILVNNQLRVDAVYLRLSDKVVNRYEKSKFFMSVGVEGFNDVIESLQTAPAAENFAEGLKKGRLGDIARTLKGFPVTTLVDQSLGCLETPEIIEGLDNLSDKLGDKVDNIDEFTREIKLSIKYLNDQKRQLEVLKNA